MHDVAEGVAHFTIFPVLKHFHKDNPFFLPTLNQRMYMFGWTKADGNNESCSITKERLDANKLHMTAFCEIFGLVRGPPGQREG